MEKVDRKDLSGAPYNPRKINDRQYKALKKSLEKYGLIQPIIWNRKTGNVVGGHQRLKALDSLMRTKNYSLDVAVVDMDMASEVAANIALNNASTMGEFDYGLVKDLSEEFDLDLASDFLFDRDELLVSFGVSLEDVQVQKRDASADADLMQSIKDRKKEVREKFKGVRDGQGDYTTESRAVLTVVFRDTESMKKVLRDSGLPEDLTIVAAEDFIEV